MDGFGSGGLGQDLFPPMNSKRDACAAAAHGDAVYIFGGFDGASRLQSAERYSIGAGTWTALAPMSSKRNGCAAATHGDAIYVFGGYDGKSRLQSAERYSIGTGTWSALSPMSSKRGACAAAAHGDAIYVFGGYEVDWSFLQSAERYSIGAGTWRALPPMSSKRRGCAATAHGDAIYVFGGYDGNSELQSAECYSISAGTWSALAPMSSKRDACAAAAHGDAIYVFGGYDGWSELHSAERYSIGAGTWSALPPMSSKRSGCAAATHGDAIYIFGGYDGLTSLQSAERFDTFMTLVLSCEELGARFKKLDRLGNGATNVVWKVRVDESEYAGKQIIALSSAEFRETFALDSAEALRAVCGPDGIVGVLHREIEVHKRLQHPHLAKFVGVINETIHGIVVPKYVLQELGEGGTVQDLIKRSRGRLDEQMVAKLARELFDALRYLHSQGVLHRDLKPANILLDQGGSSKVCDFGEARLQMDGTMTVGKVTPNYMAPELNRAEPYDEKVDVYAGGVTIMELLGASIDAGFASHKNARDVVADAHPRFSLLLEMAIHEDRAQRWTAEQVWQETQRIQEQLQR